MDIEKVVFHALTQFLALAQKEGVNALEVSNASLVLSACHSTFTVTAADESLERIVMLNLPSRNVLIKSALCKSRTSSTRRPS